MSNKKASDVQVLNQWASMTMEKVPTRVAYAAENRNLSEDAYGFDVGPGHVSCSFFKLMLCKEFSSAEWDDEILRKVTAEGSSKLIHVPKGKTAEDVAANYLGFLYDRTLKSLKNMMGVNWLADTAILFNLTVPATWSAEAREVTKRAALRGGFEDRDGDEVVLTGQHSGISSRSSGLANNVRRAGVRSFGCNEIEHSKLWREDSLRKGQLHHHGRYRWRDN